MVILKSCRLPDGFEINGCHYPRCKIITTHVLRGKVKSVNIKKSLEIINVLEPGRIYFLQSIEILIIALKIKSFLKITNNTDTQYLWSRPLTLYIPSTHMQ